MPIRLNTMLVGQTGATNAVDAASRLRRIVEDLDGIVGIELMHAAQAIDLRLRDDFSRSLTLGRGSGTLFKNFRGEVLTWECKPTGGQKNFAFSP
jgi:histidine ammonia-lyase